MAESDTAVLDEQQTEAPPAPPAPPAPAAPKRSPAPVKPKPQPPYAVILENDDFHTFHYVIEMLQRIFAKPVEEAVGLALKIHNEGEALIWSGSQEVAELKRDQVRGYGPDFYAHVAVRFPLGVRIEPLS